MPARINPDEICRRKRALRLRIGRSRRMIDARLRATGDQTRHLLSWRTYAARYPAWALAAALGAGLVASAGLKPRRMSRWLGLSLVGGAYGQFRRRLWADLLKVWANSTPER
jgi:hypothetical protein